MVTIKPLFVSLLAVAAFAAQAEPVDRAAVRAEAVMAVRSGLVDVQSSEVYDPTSYQAQQAQAKFQRLMNGPEYAAELQRQSDRLHHVVASRSQPGNAQ